jgi:hypothetical protein
MMYAVALQTARRYAEANMTSEVVMWRPAEATLNDVTGYLTAQEMMGIYTGKARIYNVAGPLMLGIGDESQEFQNTYISIPVVVPITRTDINNVTTTTWYETDPRPDDLVEITANVDPLMVGRVFRCRDVEAGGQLTTVRRMTCMGVEDASHWFDSGAPPIPVEWL